MLKSLFSYNLILFLLLVSCASQKEFTLLKHGSDYYRKGFNINEWTKAVKFHDFTDRDDLDTKKNQPPEIVEGKRNFQRLVEYPKSARLNGITGTVRVALYINKKGRLMNVRTLSRVAPILTKSVIKAAYSVSYKPATKNGKPVKSISDFSTVFKMKTF